MLTWPLLGVYMEREVFLSLLLGKLILSRGSTLMTSSKLNTSQRPYLLFFFLINLLIYLFLAALGLCCCARAFSSRDERGQLFVVVRGLLIVVASLVAEHEL